LQCNLKDKAPPEIHTSQDARWAYLFRVSTPNCANLAPREGAKSTGATPPRHNKGHDRRSDVDATDAADAGSGACVQIVQ
jgi:hypothetical protein